MPTTFLLTALLALPSTSISDGIVRARQLFADEGRVGATKIVLLLSDGEQARTAPCACACICIC